MEGQRIYLSTLLFHCKGATAFSKISRVDGVQYSSFRGVCKTCGLFSDEVGWEQGVADAFRSRVVPLTYVFATILANCQASRSPEILKRSLPDVHYKQLQLFQKPPGLN